MAGTGALEPSGYGLRSIRLLEGVPLPALEQLARQCRWRRYAAGQRVVSRAARDNDVYLIVAGRVRITSFSAAGREVAFGEMRKGDWFGDFAAIDGLSRSADVVAIDDTLLAAMTPALFRQLLRDHPEVCDRVLRRFVKSIRELTERIFVFSTLGVQNRLHAEVLRLARQAGVAGNVARIDPVPTHSEIAGHISTYREQVTRELSAMVKEGLIQRARGALVVPDVSRLERVVAEARRIA